MFCINKNSPSGALVKDYWPGDDLFAPDPQGRYPAGGFVPDVYNDRWGTKPGVGNDDTNYPTNYLASRAWRKSASRSDKIDYFLKYMIGESLADSVANEWANKQTNGQALAFTDEFAADQSARVAGPFTVSVASPAVFTRGAHGFVLGQEIRFTTTGTLPTGLTANTPYFVTAIPTKSTFRVSATPGGPDVATSGTQSGTHSIKARAPGRTMDFPMEKGLGEYGGGGRLWGANPRGGTGDDEVYLECIHHWMDGTLNAFLISEGKAPLTHYGVGDPALSESGWWGLKEADYKTIACNSTNMPIAYKILAGNGWAQGLVNTYSQIYSDPARHTPGAYVEARASLFNYRDNPPASQSEFPPRLIHEMPDSLAQWFKDWMPEVAQAMLVATQPLPIPNITIPTSFHLAKGLRNQLPWVMSHGYNDMVEFLVTTGAPTTGSPALGNADLDQNADNIISVDEVDQRGPVAISIGSPAVFTRSGHGLAVGRTVQFSAQAASDTVPSPKLPDGIAAGTTYYVVAVPSTSTFQVSETSGGAAIVTSGTQSGTHRVTPNHLYDYNTLANKRMTLETGATRFDPYAGANVYEACITTSVNAEAGETIKVVFHDPCNATLNGGTAAVECLATIVDGFVVGDVVVNEDAGLATLTVSRAASNGLATQVTWRSREVPRQTGSNSLLTPFTATATAGADFVEASGVLVFGANDLAQTFTVPFTDDALEEGAEEFWVEIGIAAGQPGAILDAYAKVRINANDGSALQGWSGLVGHFDAADDASFTLSGSEVSAWKNKVSGQGDLASPFVGNRPTRAVQTYAPYTGGASLNMPGVVFQTGDSVSQDYMEASALSGVSKAIDGTDPDATLIAVMRLTATGFQSMLGWSLNNSTTAGDIKALSLRRSTTNSVNYRTGPADAAPSVVSAPNFPANQLFIVALAKSPTGLSLWTVLAGGAASQITGAPGISEVAADIAGTFSGQMFGLGSQRAPATGGSLALDTGIAGTIHEVVVSRDRQSDAEIRAVMLELAAKWKFGLA